MYDKVMARGGFQALQDMREASKTGDYKAAGAAEKDGSGLTGSATCSPPLAEARSLAPS
mgnify:CR=1 FL=1